MFLPLQIFQWLCDRGITKEIIEKNNLNWNGTHIVIPIKDLRGNFLFNKYRRDPFGPTDIPKYKYDAGTTTQLFGTDAFPGSSRIILCEGELDALRLHSAGYPAVSSTGGAGSFKDEWVSMFSNKEVFICYDNDEAGIKGAVKLLTKFPGKLVLLPTFFNGKEVKDVTDFFCAGGDFESVLQNAEVFPFLSDPVPEFTLIKDIHEFSKKFKYHLEHMLVKERHLRAAGKAHGHIDEIRQMLLNALDGLQRKERNIRLNKKSKDPEHASNKLTQDDVLRAKQVPIETLYEGSLKKTGNKMVGKCPFHNESSGSFTIYLDQNNWYCFGCSAGRDSVDFVMKKDGVTFIDAVKSLIK